MPKCRDCENFQPKNETEGYCYGERLILADQPIDNCPENDFQPKKIDPEKNLL